MKRNTLYAFFISLALVLSACGSNDKSDKSLEDFINTKVFSATAGSLTIDNNLRFSTSIPFKKLVGSDLTVALNNFDLKLTGCELVGAVTYSPTLLVLDGGKDSQKSITVSGKVKNACSPTGYTLSADKKMTLEGQSSTTYGGDILNVRLDANGNPIGSGSPVDPSNPTVDGNFSFYNIPSSIAITSASKEYPIKLQLIDKALKGVSGKTIDILAYDNRFGEIKDMSVETDSNGYANFIYTAPTDLSPINGQTLPLTVVFDDNGTRIDNTNITLSFSVSGNTPNSYNFMNATSIIVKTASEEQKITVDLVDGSGVGIVGKEVRSTLLPSAFGSLSPAKVQTDTAGRATFNYTAPSNLTSVDGQSQNVNLLFTDENDNTITAVATITIQSSSVGGTTYSLVNENGTTINYATQSAEIAVQVTKNGSPIAGESVTAKSIPAAFGRIENATAISGTDGYARFTYIAADILTDGTQPLELVHTDSNGAESSVSVDIVVLAKPLYEFKNESNITIEHGGTKRDLKVQLTFKGIPIASKTIKMSAFPATKGSISNGYTVTTDSGGYATFFYESPVSLDDVNGTTLTLPISFDEGAIHLETNILVSFNETTDSVEGNVSLPIVVIPTGQREIILESNSKTVEIAIAVFKDISPYASGSVKVELPNKVLNGVDVGQFSAYEVPVNSQGIATFSYTGPSNLQALISNDDNDSTFKFYHVENSIDKQDMKVIYQLPANPHVSRNYEIDIVTSGDFSMGIPDKEKTFNVLLKAKDSAGNEVTLTDETITKITVVTTNSTVAQLLDTATSTLVSSLELNPINNSPFILKSKELSGLVPVEITIEFNDANNDSQSLSTIVNVRVFSGPPSAISISYVSTGQDAVRAKYIEKMAISVTDEYGNRVNTQPNITLGAIVGYAVDGREASNTETNNTKRLFYGRDDITNGIANGEIKELGDNDVTTTEFEDNTAARIDVFKYVNTEGNNTDKLVIFGAGKHYQAMGKWDMELGGDNHTLTLQDNYFGIDRSSLYYAVGHNYYQDQCRQDGREWVGSTDSETYKLDIEGTVVIDYKYDYHLGGKDALVWVNLDGLQPDTGEITRIGEANKAPLRTAGLVPVPFDGYTIPKGTRGHVEFEIWHENAPERYRNANFGYAIKAGSTCAVLAVRKSTVFDARTCDNRQSIIYDHDDNATTPDAVVGTAGNTHGGAYVSFYLQAPLDKDCNFAIDRVVVSSEF